MYPAHLVKLRDEMNNVPEPKCPRCRRGDRLECDDPSTGEVTGCGCGWVNSTLAYAAAMMNLGYE